jgi:NADPH-dependent curcumin reductase CurA
MTDAPSYAPPVEVGGVMVGGTIGETVDSRSNDLAIGDSFWATPGGSVTGLKLLPEYWDIVDGLENGPEAFIGMLEGRHFGKLLIRL